MSDILVCLSGMMLNESEFDPCCLQSCKILTGVPGFYKFWRVGCVGEGCRVRGMEILGWSAVLLNGALVGTYLVFPFFVCWEGRANRLKRAVFAAVKVVVGVGIGGNCGVDLQYNRLYLKGEVRQCLKTICEGFADFADIS